MKKLLILMMIILSLALAGCTSDAPVSRDSSDDEETTTTSSSKKDNTDDEFSEDSNSDNSDFITPSPDEDEDTDGIIIDNEDSEDTSGEEAEIELIPGERRLSSPRTLTLPQMGTFVLKSYIISESYGDKIVTLKGDFTNLRPDSDWSLSTLFNHCDAYQDDIRLSTIGSDMDVDRYTQVKPGKTIEATYSYTLRTTTDDVEVIGTDYNRVEYSISFPLK